MITFEQVTKQYPDGTVAVDGLNLNVPDGKTMILVGPSGCGKTTSLRMINRLVEPTNGRIILNGRDVQQRHPAQLRRGIGYVIQETGLFPHRTVEDNISTVPLLIGWHRSKARARARDLMQLVGLDPALARRYPSQLSGGQQQRVGVARALAADPPVLLMDEPFSAVDPIVRATLQDELIKLQGELHKTIVMVTHDVEEAFFRTVGLDLDTGAVLSERASVAEALDAAARAGQSWILVTDSGRKPRGWLSARHLRSLPGSTPLRTVPAEDFGHTFTVGTDSLRAALDAAVLSPAGQAIGADESGRVVGLMSYDRLRMSIQAAEAAAPASAAEPGPSKARTASASALATATQVQS